MHYLLVQRMTKSQVLKETCLKKSKLLRLRLPIDMTMNLLMKSKLGFIMTLSTSLKNLVKFITRASVKLAYSPTLKITTRA